MSFTGNLFSKTRALTSPRFMLLAVLFMFFVVQGSATEIESGYVQVSSTGSVTEDIGFRPDYIEFISAQQIDSLNFEESVSTNSNCPANVNGWSEGSVIFDAEGTSSGDVDKQFSIGAFRNSDSTNDHRVASSTSHVIKNVYTNRNGGTCGELRISVSKPTSNGFEVDVEDKYSAYNEIVRYKAYQFPDNMKFDAGMVKIDSTGSKYVSTGFQPANIHIRAGQQISGKNVDKQFTDNDPDDDNTLGRSKGYATLDQDGNLIDQQSIGTASSSDSTNAHRSIASDQYVLNTAYVGQNGNLLDSSEPSRLRARVTGADSSGFSMQVDDKWSGTDDVFLYRAWGFSYYDFDIGYKTIGFRNWASGEPNDNGDEDVTEFYSDGGWNDQDGGSESQEGICEYSDGTYDTTSSMSWSNAKSECESRGGHLAIIENSNENKELASKYGSTKWIGLYQESGASEPDGGWKWVDPGIGKFDTGFKPNAIDIYAEQQIDAINQEVVTAENSGCDNAGGWSNGFYEADDSRQWSIGMGRTSDSQNSHRQGSSTTYALNNLYSGQNGEDCGNFQGEVTGISDSGFEMDFTYDSSFKSNYGSETVYFRAFDFQLAPPQVENIDFYNKSEGHAFGLVANISEGSNDISDCEITAESDAGNQETYDGTITQINSTYSKCRYEWIRYDDNPNWEDRHDSNGELLRLDVKINASGVDGFWSEKTGQYRFPNNEPTVTSIDFADYDDEHAFNVSGYMNDVDSENPYEIGSCQLTFSDDDGNTVVVNPSPDYSYGNTNQSECFYSNVNRSMPVPSGTFGEGFEVKEDIQVEVKPIDVHSGNTTTTGTHPIPNSPPYSENPSPKNNAYISSFPVTLSATVKDDEEEDEINLTVYDETDDIIYSQDALSDDQSFSFEWDVPDATYSQYEWTVETSDHWASQNITYYFNKIIGSAYRSKLGIDFNYTSIIMEAGSNEYASLTVENEVNNRKNLTISLEGVKAKFLDGSSTKNIPDFPKQSSETYRIRVTPDQAVNDDLLIRVQNNDINVNTTERIPVRATGDTRQTGRDVPGIGFYQLLVLFTAATVLYSVGL